MNRPRPAKDVSTSKCIQPPKKGFNRLLKLEFIIHVILFMILNIIHLHDELQGTTILIIILLSCIESVILRLLLRLIPSRRTDEADVSSPSEKKRIENHT